MFLNVPGATELYSYMTPFDEVNMGTSLPQLLKSESLQSFDDIRA